MSIHILLFGQLTDITNTDAISLDGIIDTNNMVEVLHQTYPALANASYLVAVDKKVIKSNTLLTNNCTVALLPPFSGG